MEMYISAEYRQRKREFKNSCRIYISEKSHLLSLEKKYPFLKNEPATEDSAILHELDALKSKVKSELSYRKISIL